MIREGAWRSQRFFLGSESEERRFSDACERGCTMAEERDFERAWLSKFSACLDEVVGEQLRNEVMEGSEGLSSRSSRQEVIHWSRRAMERLDAQVDEEKRKAILTGCACQYPKSDLQAMRKAYEATGDAGLAPIRCCRNSSRPF